MRKILSLLGIITLCGATTTNIIACGKGENSSPVQKTNLNTIIELTGLNLVADITKKIKDFDSQILNANEFKKHSLVPGYILKYYASKDKSSLLNKDTTKQKSGNFFIILQANNVSDDPYWFGATNFLLIKVN